MTRKRPRNRVETECRKFSEIADLLHAGRALARCPIASIRKAAARNLPVIVVPR